jgi:hypothetical protein
MMRIATIDTCLVQWARHYQSGHLMIIRSIILVPLFLFFLYFARKDYLYHRSQRVVPVAERLLHGAIGFMIGGMFLQAILGHSQAMLLALLLFVVLGGVDEYLFHRGIPGAESDIHAKEHLALMIFVVASLVTDWLQEHPGQVSLYLKGAGL